MHYLQIISHLIILRTSIYFESIGFENNLDKFPKLKRMAQSVGDKQLQFWANATGTEKERYDRIVGLIGGTAAAQSVLEMAVAVVYVPEFSAYLNYYMGSPVTMQLAFELEGITFPAAEAVNELLQGISKIFYIDQSKSPVCYSELLLDDRIYWYMMGSDELCAKISAMCEFHDKKTDLHPLYAYQSEQDDAADFFEKGGSVLELVGTGGRKFLSKHIAAGQGKNLLIADSRQLDELPQELFEEKCFYLVREAILQDAMLCIHGLEDRSRQMELISFAKKQKLQVILTSDKVRISEQIDKSISLKPLSFREKVTLWDSLSKLYQVDIDSKQFSLAYQITPSEAQKTLVFYKKCFQAEKIDNEKFARLYFELMSKDLESPVGEVVYPEVKLQYVQVSEEMSQLLHQVIASVRGAYTIFEEWNLKKNYPYGRAVTVLMEGPPGTGKTMSAYAIANELGIGLYQVNISSIVDKYIGETEKHLEQAFTIAEKNNLILFFDEADSIFGKRNEASDSKDRFANTQISYLLQRIERFQGIVIMTTNFQNNIDPAFSRRLKYIIHFQNPTEEQRKRIWMSCFPEQLPVDDDLDFDYLAEKFEFSGGTIKNVVLNACAIALYEGKPLNMLHILKSTKSEYQKIGRNVDRTFWGEYGFLEP